MSKADLVSRIRGAWYGVFVGDALGTTLEFQPKPSARPSSRHMHTQIMGGGTFGLETGDFTDDGALTLCLAMALAEDAPPEMNLNRQLQNYVRWMNEGFCSSNGRCFDIGNQTAKAIIDYERTGDSTAMPAQESQGNGSLMRAIPVPLWLARHSDIHPNHPSSDSNSVGEASSADQGIPRPMWIPPSTTDWEEYTGDSRFKERAGLFAQACKTTHNSRACVICCVIYSEVVLHALSYSTKYAALKIARELTSGSEGDLPGSELVLNALDGKLDWEGIDPSGWVVKSLAIAFWGLREFDSFEEGMIEVVNLRGDSDTNGAIYGGLAGAVYGIEAIPERWLDALKQREMLEETLAGLVGEN